MDNEKNNYRENHGERGNLEMLTNRIQKQEKEVREITALLDQLKEKVRSLQRRK